MVVTVMFALEVPAHCTRVRNQTQSRQSPAVPLVVGTESPPAPQVVQGAGWLCAAMHARGAWVGTTVGSTSPITSR